MKPSIPKQRITRFTFDSSMPQRIAVGDTITLRVRGMPFERWRVVKAEGPVVEGVPTSQEN